MGCIAIIPARYGSTRFKGKVIADLCGKPVIQHVYENGCKAKLVDQILIATDDVRVKEAAKSFGAKVIMTSKRAASGTERIIEALEKENLDSDIVVNIQADEPMIKPEMIDLVAKCLLQNENINIATLKKKITQKSELLDSNVVKVVTDKNDFALYFSRSTIPYISKKENLYHYKHLGLYGYRKDFLLKFAQLPASELEKRENLEQLRILENGFRIKVLSTEYETIGIDTPEDLERVKKILEKQEKKTGNPSLPTHMI